ncbi:LOW QUALITY PROTEIN: putative leucine-rich repeat-containing protein DDB_G0290503 [Bombyx mandarina]|uniref:LOW QUALITY PROTEIN: putative leucine-rich repeat-containing protein DDB_G0290503 n=1 Tax=Bombyx mandarina TaxID=7092 RepID=A0A6J2JKM4_BOMMA|nr:LOW QUALITY PROTEIN: putative leucine-rich repeat-containing protein DDB_G0290503 [Bombyx mandarina]
MDRAAAGVDECYMTALQIFDYCGTERSGSLRVDDLMDKFAPFVKTNRSEYTYLKSLLDPDKDNPEISVTKLATALHRYSESQKTKLDFDESFNLKSGQAPQDSDSGISTDGFQLLEELQSELREKAHLAQQLRSQLDFTDRQHEEALAALTAERDSMRSHLSILREENAALTHARRDYEEATDRLLASERALGDVRRELDTSRRRARVLHEQVTTLENEKLTLQELLSKSKDECHRINDMYASRQSALLEENETLKSEHADLTARLQDHNEFMQQIIKEKVLLEMELKDVLNKSNQTHTRMDRSIDISYTDDQMLTALDSLNADSRFTQENRILDEESFANALRDDQGRSTNMSLFDEIRLSFCNVSRHNATGVLTDRSLCQCHDDSSFTAVFAQTDNREASDSNPKTVITTETKCHEDTASHNDVTAEEKFVYNCTRVHNDLCENLNSSASSVVDVSEAKRRCSITIGTQTMSIVINTIDKETRIVETDKNDSYHNSHKVKIDKSTNTEYKTQRYPNESITETRSIVTQTDENDSNVNNVTAQKCIECERKSDYTAKLERDLRHSRRSLDELQTELRRYEDSLASLQNYADENDSINNQLRTSVKELQSKILVLEKACVTQKESIENFELETKSYVRHEKINDNTSVATQVDQPCADCERRLTTTANRSLRSFFWDSIKCLFQMFAIICFACAVVVLYGVTRRTQAQCGREPVPGNGSDPRRSWTCCSG